MPKEPSGSGRGAMPTTAAKMEPQARELLQVVLKGKQLNKLIRTSIAFSMLLNYSACYIKVPFQCTPNATEVCASAKRHKEITTDSRSGSVSTTL